ncbi:GGDEF domain-containing protein [Hamadaea sp. NPDC051192]|uniref:GGDEF domain-containing protein n=1 Tax=Hamadaea sp. NPDC051192 TaxID=3154940 RepID=UPI00343FED1F
MNAVAWLLAVAAATTAAVAVRGHQLRIRLTRQLAEATWRADHDQLTRLANRYVLDRALTRWLAGHQRVTVAMIDLDDLHGINRRLTHAAGDLLLWFAARRMQQVAEHTGAIAVRLGGDEFVLAWPDLDPTQVDAHSMTLFEHLTGEPIDLGRRTMPIRACIGVATVTSHGHSSPSTLLAHADQAVAYGKQAGRNQRVLWHPGLSTGDGHTARPIRRLRDRT